MKQDEIILRRTKTKLKFFEEEGFYWLMMDLAQQANIDDIFDHLRKLRETYMEHIKEETKDAKQTEIKWQ